MGGGGGRQESRARKKTPGLGKEPRHRRWIVNEWTNLVHLYDAGLTVPPPVELLEESGGYRMAFIGDGLVAAPRLEALDLDRSTPAPVWDQLLQDIPPLLPAQPGPRELSPYN